MNRAIVAFAAAVGGVAGSAFVSVTGHTSTQSMQKDVFIDKFTRWVTDVVLEDPTIVRAGYWKCRDDYRWR